MAKAGRPPAEKCLTDALRIAVKEPYADGRPKARVIADKLVQMALEGDREAIKLTFERLEGKPVQPIDATVRRDLSEATDAELAAIARGRGPRASEQEDSAPQPGRVH